MSKGVKKCRIKKLNIWELYTTMTTNLVQESSNNFCCKNCDYTSCRKSQCERHLNTTKHIETTKRLQNNNVLVQEHICDKCKKIQTPFQFVETQKTRHFNS